MSFTQIKLAAGLLCGVLLLAAIWWLNGRLDRANEADALQEEYDGYVSAVAKRDRDQTAQLEKDAKATAESLQRLEAGQHELAILAQQPVKTVVYRETKTPDGTICAQPAIAAEWLRNYNATAAAASPAR